MRDIIHTENGSCKYNKCSRIIIDTKVLRKLVICTLNKGTVNRINRLSAACRNTGCESNSRFFSDANINKLLSCKLSFIFSKSENSRCCRCNGNNIFIVFYFFQKIISCNRAVIFPVKAEFRLTRFNIKRHTPMPRFLIFFCKGKAFTLLSDNMNYYRFLAILYFLKSRNKLLNIISVFHKNIIKSH